MKIAPPPIAYRARRDGVWPTFLAAMHERVCSDDLVVWWKEEAPLLLKTMPDFWHDDAAVAYELWLEVLLGKEHD